MSARATYAAGSLASLRFLYALAAVVASFCALTHGAQARPLITWSTNRANPGVPPGAANGNTDIWVMDNLGQSARRLTDDEGDEGGPSWSPDGKQIAFHHSKFVDGFRRYGMSIVDSAGGPWTLLTDDPAGGNPAWSPTGKEIAFGSFRDLKVDIYVVDVDGSNLRNLTRHAAHDGEPAWSPDGSQIAFASNRRTGGDFRHIHVMDADGRNVRALTDGKWFGEAPTWSSDGSEVAYWGRGAGVVTFIVPALGGQPRRMTETVEWEFDPAWSPDGRQMAVRKRGDIWVYDLDSGESTNLTDDGGAVHDYWPDWFDSTAPRLGDLAVRALMTSLTPWGRLKRP